MIYADLHQQFIDERRRRRLVNAGSAGNDLCGDTTAAYLWLEPTPSGVDTQLLRVDYDVEAEIEVARELRIPFLEHWVAELETAVYQPRF